MKILIADDCPTRYAQLENELREKNILPGLELQYAQCARDLRDALADTEFDLLILDVLLPNRPSEIGNTAQHSMDILSELGDDSELFKPAYILGITGDSEAYKDNQRCFEDNTWTILRYDQTSTEWIARIVNCINYINKRKSEKNKNEILSQHDLVIVCALEIPELSEVLKLDWNWKPARPLDNLTFIHEGSFISNNKPYRVAAAAADRMGMVEAALLTARLIDKLQPRSIVMLGICAGVPEKTKLGDILFADPVWNYQSGKLSVSKTGKDHFQFEPIQIPSDQEARSLAKQAIDSNALRSIYNSFPENPPALIPDFKVGPIATGSTVLADGREILKAVEQNRKLLGIEMEIFGVFAAAQKSELRPKTFALKSVCDFASPDKADDIQKYCSYLSAQSLRVLMERFGKNILDG